MHEIRHSEERGIADHDLVSSGSDRPRPGESVRRTPRRSLDGSKPSSFCIHVLTCVRLGSIAVFDVNETQEEALARHPSYCGLRARTRCSSLTEALIHAAAVASYAPLPISEQARS